MRLGAVHIVIGGAMHDQVGIVLRDHSVGPRRIAQIAVAPFRFRDVRRMRPAQSDQVVLVGECFPDVRPQESGCACN